MCVVGLTKNILLLSTTFPLLSCASVDLRTASFSKAWKDFVLPGPGKSLSITREYSSRSLHNGVFGFGWCASFESFIKIRNPYAIDYFDCQLEHRIRFRLKPRPPRASAKSTAAEKTSARYETEALGFGFFMSEVDSKAERFIYYPPSGGAKTFNKHGTLVELLTPDGQKLRMSYSPQGQLIAINHKRLVWRLSFDNLKEKIESIVSPKGQKTLFNYKDENLIRVDRQNGEKLIYEYDELHNMTGLQGSKENIKLRYKPALDQLVQMDDGLCATDFSYIPNGAGYRVDTTKNCNEKIEVTRTKWGGAYMER